MRAMELRTDEVRLARRMRLVAAAAAMAASALATALAAGVAGAQQAGAKPASAKQAGAQPAGDVNALVARAAATYERARTATGTFEQTLTNPLTGTSATTRGEFQRQQPDRFDFRFTDPKGDRIVADGRWLWVYTPSSTPGQVIKLPLSAAGAGALDLGAQFFDEPQRRFAITEGARATVNGRATRVLTLTPRTADQPFSRATVWLDAADGRLHQFETLDGMGIKRRVTITAMQVNVPVQAQRFAFTPPKGVRVVDQATLTGGRR